MAAWAMSARKLVFKSCILARSSTVGCLRCPRSNHWLRFGCLCDDQYVHRAAQKIRAVLEVFGCISTPRLAVTSDVNLALRVTVSTKARRLINGASEEVRMMEERRRSLLIPVILLPCFQICSLQHVAEKAADQRLPPLCVV